jgi:hypothetical protein
MRELFGQLFDVGRDILHVAINGVTNVISVQLGDSTLQSTDADAAAFWQAPGLVSLPAPPSQGAASCQALILKGTDRDIVFAARDTRVAGYCADMQPGESCLFGTTKSCNANNGRVVARVDGSIELRSTAKLDLGGGATDAVALASKVDAINSDLKTFAQAVGALTLVPQSGVSPAQLANLVAASNALASSISSVASQLIKAK